MFKRLGNLIRGFLGLFIGGLEKQNPEALLEVEKENLREQIQKYNQGLAAHAAQTERLMRQIRAQEEREKQLRAKVTAHLKAGNRTNAGQHALNYQEVQRELAENREQLKAAEQTYKELTRARDASIKAARKKIEGLKRSIGEMRMQRATAELNEMAAGMISEIGGAGDTLNRLEEMVEEERANAVGRARVAKDALGAHDIDLSPAEEEALAEQALADFAAAEGLTISAEEKATPETEAGEDRGKSMGPVAESQ